MSEREKPVEYVVIMPDGTEHFTDTRLGGSSVKCIAEHAVRASGLTTSRYNPQAVSVTVHRLEYGKGQCKRHAGVHVDAMPCFEPLTEAEFNNEMDSLLTSLPAAFHLFVREYSWEHGHSCGLEEVLNMARDLTDSLEKCVAEYRKAIKA